MNDTQAKYPQLRFKGFTDPWEQRILGEWSDVRDGTHASPKYIEQGHPMVTSKNLTDSGLDMSDVSYLTDEDFNEINQRSKVDIGDILFGMIGTIGKPVIVDRDDFAIKNVALIKEKTPPEIINTWLIQYLKSPSFERFIQKENAGGTQKFIALGLIRYMKLMTPSVQEQARIGEFFTSIDNLIAANQRKLAKLKELKQGYLQKMFPKNGAKVPELRFAGFADDWEERKLTDVTYSYSGLTYSPTDVQDKGTLVLRSSNIKNDQLIDADNVYVNPDIVNSNNVKVGDVIVVVRNGSRSLIGKHAIVTKEMPHTVIGAFMSAFRGENGDYINALLSTNNFQKEVHKSLGATINQITGKDFSMMNFLTPKLEEQNKIGSFFKQLDDTIALHQRKLDLLKEQKKGFLQKMFV